MHSASVPDCPPYMVAMISNVCNYRCPGCFHGMPDLKDFFAAHEKYMPFERFRRIADEVAPYSIKIGLNSLGEIFLNKDVYEILSYAHAKGLRTEFDTNGSLMDPQALAKSCPTDVIVSIDGMDQQAYETYRKGGQLQRALDNLADFAGRVSREKLPTKIYVKYLVNRYTENTLEQAKTYFEALPGVSSFLLDYFVLPPPSYDYWFHHPNQVPLDVYERWRPVKFSQFDMYVPDQKAGIARHKATTNTQFAAVCQNVFKNLYVDTNGDAYPCCQAIKPMLPSRLHYPQELLYGNVFQGGVLGTFHGAKAQAFRAAFVEKGGRLPHCADCRSNYVERPLTIIAEQTRAKGLKTLLDINTD